jgi:DNA gyrase/topoisomerase IV subunit A
MNCRRPGAVRVGGRWSTCCPSKKGERINAVCCRCASTAKTVSCSWPPRSGTVKKTPLIDFSRPRSNGIIAVDLRDDDQLIGVDITDGSRVDEISIVGRNTQGVKLISPQGDEKLIGLEKIVAMDEDEESSEELPANSDAL